MNKETKESNHCFIRFTWRRNYPNKNNFSKIKNNKNGKWFKEFLNGLTLALNRNAPYNSNLNGIYTKRAFIKNQNILYLPPRLQNSSS